MKKPGLVNGYLNVFPNYKHQNREDGYGCANLSPKSMGPINHKMPNLPSAKNLENYHQFAKFWDFEFDSSGKIKDKYFKKRKEAYLDETPHRHKYDREFLAKINGGNVNIPKCSIYYDKKEKPHEYSYLECRFFYCKFYQEFAVKSDEYKYLKKKLDNGYNLNIIGYDGYPPDITSLMKMYKDISKPFGHEMVLYTLLVEEDQDKYPWNIFYKENKKIYQGVIY